MALPHGRKDTFTALAIVLVFVGLSVSADARGREPHDVFAQSIVLSDSPFPARFSTDKALISYVNRMDQKEFWQEKHDGDWLIFYMAFFAEQLERRTYVVQFFDITDANKPLYVTETQSWPSKSGVRITSGEYLLSAEIFKPDTKYLMLFSRSTAEPALAEAIFVLRPFDPNAANRRATRRKAAGDKLKSSDPKKKSTPTWTPPDW
jgi:hypothetical protein